VRLSFGAIKPFSLKATKNIMKETDYETCCQLARAFGGVFQRIRGRRSGTCSFIDRGQLSLIMALVSLNNMAVRVSCAARLPKFSMGRTPLVVWSWLAMRASITDGAACLSLWRNGV
jgi:hypothetical protein